MPFLDKHSPIDITYRGNLPHWHQEGKIQFITFRLAGSIPDSRAQEIKAEIQSFISLNPKPWDAEIIRRYRRFLGNIIDKMLDSGYGECYLSDPSLRKIVADSILFADKVNYEVYAFVIMPNHVHLLIQPFENHTVRQIVESIKKYTSRRINAALHRSGKLWQKESFDRIVRSEEMFRHYYHYIRMNPRNLPSRMFTLYIR